MGWDGAPPSTKEAEKLLCKKGFKIDDESRIW